MNVRRPPTFDVFKLHLPMQGGKCRWCGQPVLDASGKPYTRAKWHDHCLHDYKVIAWPAYARNVVEKRDKAICADCGGDFSRPARFVFVRREYFSGWCSLVRPYYAWQVEHHVPLWKVTHLPPLQRLEYFRLPNLKTRCDDCHGRKTSDEAAERAHLDRLADGGRKRSGRKMMSRGFDKTRTKHFDGTVTERET